MSRTEEVFIPALEGKKIPILTLDNKWHRLFTQSDPSPQIKKGEEELNSLLKRQGKLTTESKELKALRKSLLDEIVGLADEAEQGNKSAVKKLEKNKRLIDECKEKMEAHQDELFELPAQIDAVNYKLMLATMESCYDEMRQSTQEVQEISDWIGQIRRELKKKIIRKQEKALTINNLYQYMHQIFGMDVIEVFDMKYIPQIKKAEDEDKEKDEENE